MAVDNLLREQIASVSTCISELHVLLVATKGVQPCEKEVYQQRLKNIIESVLQVYRVQGELLN